MILKRKVGIFFLLVFIFVLVSSSMAQNSSSIVKEIKITGNKCIKEKEIRKVIKSKVGQPLSSSQIKEDLQAIYEMGFFTSDMQVFKEEIEGGIRLIFEVKENSEIAQIELKGLEEKEEEKISHLLSFKKGDLWNFKKIEESKDKILQFFHQQGFPFIQVNISQIPLKQRECKVLLEIEKGNKFFVSKIEIRGNQVIPISRIQKIVSPREGEIFVSGTLEHSLETIRDIYGERGYLYVWVKSEIEKEDNKIKIIILIEEGPQVKVGKIKIEGNKTCKKMVFRHNLLLKEGDVFNVEKLKESGRKLYNLGFFEKVEIIPLSTFLPEVLDLLVKVKEQERRGDISLGAAYKESGWVGFINISKDNLWGQGKKIEVNWESGGGKNEYNLGYLDRWFQDSSTQFNLNLYNKNSDYPDYNQVRYGGSIGLGWPLNSCIHAFFTLGDEEEKNKAKEGKILPEGIKRRGEYHIIKISLQKDTRLRDKSFLAYRGSYNFLSIEESGGLLLGGTQDFTRYQWETRSYSRKGDFWRLPILALRLRAGWGRDLPSEKKFKIGGQDTLRGYTLNEFEGDREILGTLEMRFPSTKDFRIVLFVDSGSVWEESSLPEKFKTGWGIGLRINTPLGLMRLDYGIREKGNEFHFGMGEGF